MNHFDTAVVRLNPNLIPNDTNARLQALCQELGHALGLDHEPEGTNTCMDYSLGGTGGYHPVPRQHDFDQANGHSNHTH